MSDLLKLTCPSCGKTLEIPRELEAFSCLYCGARSKVADVLALQLSREETEELMPELRQGLLESVTNYPDYYKKLDRASFFSAYEVYEYGNAELLKKMDACFKAREDMGEAFMDQICRNLVDDLEAYMQKDPRWKSKASRTHVMWEVKVVLAIFLTSLVDKLQLRCSPLFREKLHSLWMERWPRERWEPGQYEALVQGYKKRKFCFITTATCRHEGKADDCQELTAFRAFRDGWLTEQGGRSLIDRYYRVAPGIVTCIDLCDDPEETYSLIRRRWLEPCYRALQENRPADCRSLYVEMVQSLEKKYFS